jgi:thioredoxin 1
MRVQRSLLINDIDYMFQSSKFNCITMRIYKCKSILAYLICIIAFSVSLYGQNHVFDNKVKNTNQASIDTVGSEQAYKVTFIELGSVRCIPCREMQPIMKSIEEKYGREVRVVFHDVLSEEGQHYGVKFGIEAIPTQVFLDIKGKEYYRHVGFFSEGELVRVLKMQGVKQN